MNVSIGNPRKECTYVDSYSQTFEYAKTRGNRQAADDLAAKVRAKAYLIANPINPALKNRYCGYGYGAYLLEDWETPDTVDVDDIPRRRELCKTLHDRDRNHKALRYAQNNNSFSAQKKELVLPERADNMRKVFAYLCKTRGISADIVSQLAHEKLLYQDIRGMLSATQNTKN